MSDSNLNSEPADNYISKSQRKRDSLELRALGAELVKLSSEQLERLALPPELKEALLVMKSIKQRGALKRQLKFVGGLMRELDVVPIRENFARIKMQSGHAVRQHHNIERWRDRLIDEGDAALGVLMSEVPDVERQRVRQLIRSAQLERDQEKAPKSARALYRYLKECLE